MGINIFYGWWIVLATSVITLYVGGIIFFGFTAFIEPILKEFGWSYTQISLATSIQQLEMGLLAPLFGFLADRFGARKVILMGVIVIGSGLLFLSRTQSLIMYYGAMLILGFGTGTCSIAVPATALAHWFKKKAGVAMGIMNSGFGASGLLIPLIVWMIDTYGWRTTLAVFGWGTWFLGIPMSMIVRDKPEPYGYLPDGASEEAEESSPELPLPENETTFREAVVHRSFVYLNIIEVIRMMVLFAVILHIMPYLGSLGIPRRTAGLMVGALHLVSIIGRFGFGWLGDIWDKRYAIAWSFFLMAVGMLAFCYVQAKWVMYLFILLFSIGFGGGLTLRASILREYFGRSYFGKLIGIQFLSGSVGGMAGPTLAGWAFDTLGSYRLVWFCMSGVIALAIGLTLMIRPLKR